MNELIVLNNEGTPVTTSLKVAEVFGKRHDNVIRDIEALECSPEFAALNFEECSYLVNNRKHPMYQMTRDGWAFLVMGFTGKKAAEFKEAYIQAFNMMEDKLRNRSMNILDALKTTEGITLVLEDLRATKERVKVLEPKGEAYDQFIDTEGLLNFRQTGHHHRKPQLHRGLIPRLHWNPKSIGGVWFYFWFNGGKNFDRFRWLKSTLKDNDSSIVFPSTGGLYRLP